MAFNLAELLRRLEALERHVGTHRDIPSDVERFVHLSDSVVVRCESCDAVNIPADVWDVCRRLADGGYETLYGVMVQDDPKAEKDQAKKVWRGAEDQAYALVQVLDALPPLIECLRARGLSEGLGLYAGQGPVHIDTAVPPGCEVVAVSSRVCERGTKSCVLSHTGGSGGE